MTELSVMDEAGSLLFTLFYTTLLCSALFYSYRKSCCCDGRSSILTYSLAYLLV